ncbi:MAG: hypothetical protein C4522_18695 [Desulfobacteraceae bacterium]|nr:MAG: hypothetical protein C4522_18695 [Desulfobacteraceae bacterium]
MSIRNNNKKKPLHQEISIRIALFIFVTWQALCYKLTGADQPGSYLDQISCFPFLPNLFFLIVRPMMSKLTKIEQPLIDALEAIMIFIKETTGRTPNQVELAKALKRYFVMNEIKDHIFMDQKD